MIAALSASFFFVYFLPNFMEGRELNRRILECRKLAEERYSKNVLENENNQKLFSGTVSYADMVWPSMNYTAHYNAKLRKCIYCKVNTRARGNPTQISAIYDLYSNQFLQGFEVLSSDIQLDPDQKIMFYDSKVSFEKNRQELFEESPRK